MLDLILEKGLPRNNIEEEVRAIRTLNDIENLFERLFGIIPPKNPDAYQRDGSDYGLKKHGVETRTRLNEQCREILARVKNPEDLTPEDRAILVQYTGKGGLDDNSQWEYYTPTRLAEGMWGTMKANGFENGNVLEPSCGHGVFLGTKPDGIVMTANDMDAVGSGIARLLNPDDFVETGTFESLVMNTPDNTFDSCVGNVPFGKTRGGAAEKDPAYKKEKLPQAYFILRILDKIKPGGLAVLVVPTDVIGSTGEKWKMRRQEISRRAEFLGAHKLPSSMFGGRGVQGTDTVTDVIVLRKHGKELLDKLREDIIPTETLQEANVYWNEFIAGKYWKGEGRPFIMGKFVPRDPKKFRGRDTVEGTIDDSSLKQNLARKFHSRIKWDLLNEAEPIIRNYTEGDRRDINGEMYAFVGGGWRKVETGPIVGEIDKAMFGADSVEVLKSMLQSTQGALSLTVEQANAVLASYPFLLGAQQKNAINFAMSQIDPALREQLYRGSLIGSVIAKMGVDEEAGEDVGATRKVLQEMIIAEIEKYGHPLNNSKLTLAGASSQAFGMFQNAVDKDGKFSDLLSGTLDKSQAQGYQDNDLLGIVVYLKRQMDAPISIEDIKKRYNGPITLNSLADIAELDDLAITPDGHIETMTEYCSGDIGKKIPALKEVMANTQDTRLLAKYQEQLDILDKKIKRVPLENITFGMQQKWYGKKYLVEFLRENGFPRAIYGKEMEVEVENYDGTTSKQIRFVENTDIDDGEFRLEPNSKLTGYRAQFENYLNGDNVTSNNQERIAEYRKNVAETESLFDSWMKQHVDALDLAEKYSLDFNGFVQPEYSTESLGIDDMLSGEIIPHTYQNAEARRLSEQGSGICGFGVGLGKSFTALATVAYNEKRGRAKRTCIVVPDAVLENWYHEARMFYSQERMRNNVFFVGLEPVFDDGGQIRRRVVLDETGQPKQGKDGQDIMQDVVRFTKSKEDIFKAMWKIPQSNYSVVVMTKNKFETIPVRPETMKIYTDDMVQRGLMSAKAAETTVEKGRKKKGASYADDVRKNSLEEQFSNQGREKKDELPFLEDMGFDSIITDESHFFKNSLKKGDKTGNIQGVPSAEPSDIAVDMAIKCDYLRRKNNGRGVYGLTATPVTNSPIEIFNMLSLVCPKEEFERMGIYTVDDFVRLFGKLEDKDRYTVANEIRKELTLVGFKNLDGLRNLFHRYVNIKTVEDVDDQIHVPNAVEQEEEIDMTDEQTAMYDFFRKEAVALNKKGNSQLTGRSIFSIMRDMEKVATDMDLYHRQMTFVFSKAHKTEFEKLIPSLPTKITVKEKNEDTGKKEEVTYDYQAKIEDNGDTFKLIVHEQHEEAVLKAMRAAKIPESEANHPVAPKYAKLLANLKKHLDAGGKQIVFTEEKTQHRKLKRICVHNLPIKDEQIAIINAKDAEGDKLDAISKAYNAGSVKIVIANKKAEVGVNLQKGTTAIHHLTLPWTPASINQRNGRGVRQGNKVDSVDIYFYYAKGSFDKYKKQILNAKANWIGQLLSGTEASGENADIETKEEMAAMATGNIEEYRKKKAEAAKQRMESARSQYTNRLKILQSLQESINSLEERRKTAKEKALNDVNDQKRKLEKAKSMNKEPEAIRKSEATLARLQAKLDGLDAKYDSEKVKNESQANMLRGMLKEAAKKGELPFDASLIDNPANCVISLKGAIFQVGDVLEFGESTSWGEPEGICEIKSLNYDGVAGSVMLENLLNGKRYARINVEKIAERGKKVSYSKSEIAITKLQSGNMDYLELRNSGITREQFIERIDEVHLIIQKGGVVRDADNKTYLVYYPHEIEDDMRFVWPEPENAVFKNQVLEAYKRVSETRPHNPFDDLMEKLFGPYWKIPETSQYIDNANLIKDVWNNFLELVGGFDSLVAITKEDGNTEQIKDTFFAKLAQTKEENYYKIRDTEQFAVDANMFWARKESNILKVLSNK